jgi:hypothetical protein
VLTPTTLDGIRSGSRVSIPPHFASTLTLRAFVLSACGEVEAVFGFLGTCCLAVAARIHALFVLPESATGLLDQPHRPTSFKNIRSITMPGATAESPGTEVRRDAVYFPDG